VREKKGKVWGSNREKGVRVLAPFSLGSQGKKDAKWFFISVFFCKSKQLTLRWTRNEKKGKEHKRTQEKQQQSKRNEKEKF
jgi:hypothetical protein